MVNLYIILVIIIACFSCGWLLVKSRNMENWIVSYIVFKFKKFCKKNTSVNSHIYFCFADHYEPYWNGVDREHAHKRVMKWLTNYPKIAKLHKDSEGNSPKHTFFYPEEEYDDQVLFWLKGLCKEGYGDLEVHLHHDNDTADNLENTIQKYKSILHEKYGFLEKDEKSGVISYAFIHGNWALDNSRPDGRWCGINNELDVLVKTGCYVDMTMPSAPSDTQTKKINSIYFAKGRDGRSKSHDQGRDVKVGDWKRPGELLLVQGPLGLNWKNRKFGIIPKIENSEISFDAPPSNQRVRIWGRTGISVKGAENHVFIKVHTHGTQEETMNMLFDEGGFDLLWTELEKQYRDKEECTLHYVTAREMYRKIKELALQ